VDSTTHQKVVIVGAGHGGVNAAALLRQQGFAGEVTLLSLEEDFPYHRPPLSKDYLKGQLHEAELLLKPVEFYAEQRIALRLGTKVLSIDTASRQVHVDDGDPIAFDALILATGADPRRVAIPGADLNNVLALRTRGDAEALGKHLTDGSQVVVVGGGYVGLEVAASAIHLGATAVVLEREERVLARVASEPLATWLTGHHRHMGTVIETSVDVAAFEDRGDGSVAAVVLTDGRRFPCDVALVGVGAVPCDALAAAAGVECDGGILVDDAGRTSVDGVFAIGDATRRPLHHYDGTFRLESIPSAVEQAKQATNAILGKPAPRSEVPWFWSDQFDVKIKIAGLLVGPDETIVRGDPSSGQFAVYHCRANRVLAVETVNSGSDFMAAKQFIDRGVQLDPAQLADTSVSLRDLVG